MSVRGEVEPTQRGRLSGVVERIFSLQVRSASRPAWHKLAGSPRLSSLLPMGGGIRLRLSNIYAFNVVGTAFIQLPLFPASTRSRNSLCALLRPMLRIELAARLIPVEIP